MALLSRLMLSLSRPILMGMRRELRRCLLMAFATLFALLGVIMFAVSLFLYLRETLGAPLAAAVIAGGLLVLSGLVAGATYRLRGDRSSRPSCGEAPRKTAQSCEAQDVPAAKSDSAALQLALGALLAGVVVGASPDLRKGIIGVFLALNGGKPRQTP